MAHLAEVVQNGKDDSVSVSNYVQGYVGPLAVRYGQRLKQPSRRWLGRFLLIADRTGSNKLLDIVLQGRPKVGGERSVFAGPQDDRRTWWSETLAAHLSSSLER